MPTGVYKRPALADRFWSKVAKGDGCWEWQGGRTPTGYGVFGMGNTVRGAHRVAWELIYGPIPTDRWILHHCDNPPCVNPQHLFLGDRSTNVRDMHAKGRRSLRNDKLTREQALEIRHMAVEGHFNQRDIGDMFGVTQCTVSRIKTGSIWR